MPEQRYTWKEICVLGAALLFPVIYFVLIALFAHLIFAGDQWKLPGFAENITGMALPILILVLPLAIPFISIRFTIQSIDEKSSHVVTILGSCTAICIAAVLFASSTILPGGGLVLSALLRNEIGCIVVYTILIITFSFPSFITMIRKYRASGNNDNQQ
ncbi:MAG: hypothetical protein LBH00_02185 [Planctomycetaceae bacterium]|jgi:hypothetical protein|nr:hypothetical protein [Planctomycetaceae bacterium]